MADDANDDLTMKDHTPNLVAFEGLQVWDGGNPAAHAMTDSFVIHDGHRGAFRVPCEPSAACHCHFNHLSAGVQRILRSGAFDRGLGHSQACLMHQ